MSTLYKTAKQHRTKLSGLFVILCLILSRPTAGTLLSGVILIIIGQSIRIWSSGHIHKNRILTVTGPYSLSRNPLYVGSFVLGAGFMVAMGVIWIAVFFVIFYACVYWFTIRWEEDKLAREFPGAWESYKSAVPRFIPLLKLPEYSSGEFSWTQVTKYREMMNASIVLAVYAILWVKAILLGQV